MTDSLRAVLSDMGPMRPRVDDYHPIYMRIKALVEGGENPTVSAAPPALRAHLVTARDRLTGKVVPDSYADHALTEIKRAIAELDDAPTITTEPDVVSGRDARNLPLDSIIIRCAPDGTPLVHSSARRVRESGYEEPRSDFSYLVLYRAPVKPLKVGEKIIADTRSRLAHATIGTVLATSLRAYVRTANDEWELTGSNGVRRDMHIPLPATVVYVPKGENK